MSDDAVAAGWEVLFRGKETVSGVDGGEISGDGKPKATRFGAPFEGLLHVTKVFRLGAALAFVCKRKMARLTRITMVAKK